MQVASIAELLSPYLGSSPLSEEQLQNISTYIDILQKWNSRVNLSSVRDPEQMVTRHFGESLFAATVLIPKDATGLMVFDVGSGAGFPGLPLKIYAPDITLKLIEAHNKKAVFLREVVRALEISGVEVLSARAEYVKEEADLVTMRAVEKFEQALRTAATLVRPGGRLGLLIGERQMAGAQKILPGTWSAPLQIPGSTGRVVAEWKRKAE